MKPRRLTRHAPSGCPTPRLCWLMIALRRSCGDASRECRLHQEQDPRSDHCKGLLRSNGRTAPFEGKSVFRDFEPSGALNVPKRFLPSLAVGTIAPSATCPNLRMVRSGSNWVLKRGHVKVASQPHCGNTAKVSPVPGAGIRHCWFIRAHILIPCDRLQTALLNCRKSRSQILATRCTDAALSWSLSHGPCAPGAMCAWLMATTPSCGSPSRPQT
jgi:hypothetical protein